MESSIAQFRALLDEKEREISSSITSVAAAKRDAIQVMRLFGVLCCVVLICGLFRQKC